eukprot:gene1593-1158_t
MPPKPRPALSTAKARKTLVEKRILRSLESWQERLTDVKRVLKQDDALDLRGKKRRYMEIMNDRPRKRLNLLRVARSAFEVAGIHATFKAIPEDEVSFQNVEGEPFCNSRNKPKKAKGANDSDSEESENENDKGDDSEEDDATAAQEAAEDGRKAKRARVEKADDLTSDSENEHDDQLRRVVHMPKQYTGAEHEDSAFLTANIDPTLTPEELQEQQAAISAMEREHAELLSDLNRLMTEGESNPSVASLAPGLQKLQNSLQTMRAERQRLLQKLYYRSKVEKKLSETIMGLKVELHECRAGRIDWTQKEPVLFNKPVLPAFESYYQEHPLTTQHVRDIAHSVLVAVSQCVGSYRLPKVRPDSKVKGSRRERLLSKLRHGLTDALSILERADPSMFASLTHRLHNAAAAAAAAAAAGGNGLDGLTLQSANMGQGEGGILGLATGEPLNLTGTSTTATAMDIEASANPASLMSDPLSLAARTSAAAAANRAGRPGRPHNPLMLSAMEAATVGSATLPAAEASLLVSDASRRGRRPGTTAGRGRSGREGGVNAASLPVHGDSSHFYPNDPMLAMANAAQQAQRSGFHMHGDGEDDSEDDN